MKTLSPWRPIAIAASFLLSVVLAGCGDADEAAAPNRRDALLVDITASTGVDFLHEVTLGGNHALPEIMGSGCAIFDADGDGDLDLYFVNAGETRGKGAANRLYLRTADGRYRDATSASGLGDLGYGMGVAVGDVEGDGDLDVYVGNWGRDSLYLNDGRGTFTDVTDAAGIVGDGWTTSVAFLDHDLDGDLDIFATHYVVYDPEEKCGSLGGVADYCSPKAYRAESDVLWENQGEAKFIDVSVKVGLAAAAANGLGVVVSDFNSDGRSDVFVANDGQDNQLWINLADGGFRDDAVVMGVAVNGMGEAEASMGVALGDVDSDGDLDLFMTHLLSESNTLYLRDGAAGFSDHTSAARLHGPSVGTTGFGTAFCDLDLDGDLDLIAANGRVSQAKTVPEQPGTLVRYVESNALFLGDGRGRFEDQSAVVPDFCGKKEVSRGLAIADLDGDGDLDVVVTNCKGRARIFENRTDSSRSWLKIRAVDPKLGRRAIGARVEVVSGEFKRVDRVGSSSSYLSSWAAPLHFGLGDLGTIDSIRVTWPGGEIETFKGGPVNRTVTVVRGSGVK